jgi:hypothetical protein
VEHRAVVLAVLAQLDGPGDLVDGGTGGRLATLVCEILEPMTTEVADGSPSTLPPLGLFRLAVVLVRGCAELYVYAVRCIVQVMFVHVLPLQQHLLLLHMVSDSLELFKLYSSKFDR